MLLYCLFGKMVGNPHLILSHPKSVHAFLKSSASGEKLDPYLLFGMAKALYAMGQELASGDLKTLNLTHYNIISQLSGEYLLVFVVMAGKKDTKHLSAIESQMEKMSAVFSKHESSDPRFENGIPSDNLPVLVSEKLSDLSLQLLELLPSLKKTLKALEIVEFSPKD
jgi:hypothetical protein